MSFVVTETKTHPFQGVAISRL